jgi:hypothetical protein
MSPQEVFLPLIDCLTSACDGYVGYTVHDADKRGETYISIEYVQSKATRFDMLPAIDGTKLSTLKQRISAIEADKALAA